MNYICTVMKAFGIKNAPSIQLIMLTYFFFSFFCNKCSLLADLKAARDERREGRKDLETSWLQAAQEKIRNDPSAEDCRKYILLQEQCNKYLRCKQCQRKKDNKGASNILSESRYIGGSRLIV